ncbi:hypothetical protein O6H91_13G017500 [Diphasiastrum complanatum]|nr:hypothetical protein O6H91_13G017500 [Diphasiastrum complanatum]
MIYVQHIQEGLPLFLFDYTAKVLHGVFEAAGDGEENINPRAWSGSGGGKLFPAQVPVRIRQYYSPLPESVFRKAIAKNYYSKWHFQFELDHIQTKELCALFHAGGRSFLPYTFGESSERDIGSPAFNTRSGKAAVIKKNFGNEEDNGWKNPETFSQDGGWTNPGRSSGGWTDPGRPSQDGGWTNPGRSSQDGGWKNTSIQDGGRTDSKSSFQDGGWTNRKTSFQDGGWTNPGAACQNVGWTNPNKSFQDGGWTNRDTASQDGGWTNRNTSFQDGGWTNPDTASQDGGWNNPNTSFQDGGWTNPDTSSQDGGWTNLNTSLQDGGWTNPDTSSQKGGWTNARRSYRDGGGTKYKSYTRDDEWAHQHKASSRDDEWALHHKASSEDDGRAHYDKTSSQDDGWANHRKASSQDDGWAHHRKASSQDDGQAHHNKAFSQDDGWAHHHKASSQDDRWTNSGTSFQDNGKSSSHNNWISSDGVLASHEASSEVANDQGESAWEKNDEWFWEPEVSAQKSEIVLGACDRRQENMEDPKVENVWPLDQPSTLGNVQEDQGDSVQQKIGEGLWEPEISASTGSDSHELSKKSEILEISREVDLLCISEDEGKEAGQARGNAEVCKGTGRENSAISASDGSAIQSDALSEVEKVIADNADAEEGCMALDDEEAGTMATGKKESQVEWDSNVLFQDEMEAKQLDAEQLALKEGRENLLLALQPVDSIAASGLYKNMELCAKILEEMRHHEVDTRTLIKEAKSLVQEVCELKHLQLEKIAFQKAHLSLVEDVHSLKEDIKDMRSQLNIAFDFQ